MRLTAHDHAMLHGVAVLSRYPLARGRDNDDVIRRALGEVLPGVNHRESMLAPVVSVAGMLAASRGDLLGLADKAAGVMLDWDRIRLGMALDVIRGRT